MSEDKKAVFACKITLLSGSSYFFFFRMEERGQVREKHLFVASYTSPDQGLSQGGTCNRAACS